MQQLVVVTASITNCERLIYKNICTGALFVRSQCRFVSSVWQQQTRDQMFKAKR